MKDNLFLLCVVAALCLVTAAHLIVGHHSDQESEQPLSPLVTETSFVMSLCDDGGGQIIMTEYNTVNGLTLNCYYPSKDLIIEEK